MGRLKERMRQDLELRGLSKNTQKSYLKEAREFAKYFMRSPEELGSEEIREYLLYLLKVKKVSESTMKIAYSSLKYLYAVTLNRPWEIDRIPKIKRHKKLPVVLNHDEIKALFNSTDNIKYLAILTVIYSAGLRASEAAYLKVSDIDSKRMQIRVRNSKGAKDRYTILSNKALKLLRKYWKMHRPKDWLFPSIKKKGWPLTYKSIDRIFKISKEKAGIAKPASVHSLRHSFATHLLENGVDLHHIQLLLGHRYPETTTMYLHVRRVDLQDISSPLDLINKNS